MTSTFKGTPSRKSASLAYHEGTAKILERAGPGALRGVVYAMLLQVTIVSLCALGLYVSAFMWRKTRRAERGELVERSVVQTGRARALGGTPNAAIGVAYYAALASATFFLREPAVWWMALAAALAAAAFSLYLAWSLLYVTQMPCIYCWTSHVVNWTLVVLILLAR